VGVKGGPPGLLVWFCMPARYSVVEPLLARHCLAAGSANGSQRPALVLGEPGEHVDNGARRPLAAACSDDAALVKRFGDASRRLDAL
jgi:hypothetical protein